MCDQETGSRKLSLQMAANQGNPTPWSGVGLPRSNLRKIRATTVYSLKPQRHTLDRLEAFNTREEFEERAGLVITPQPSTLHPAPYTPIFNTPQPSTLNPQPSNLASQPSTLKPQPTTLKPLPSPLNSHQLNPQLSTPNPQPSPSTLNPNPRHLKLRILSSSTLNPEPESSSP